MKKLTKILATSFVFVTISSAGMANTYTASGSIVPENAKEASYVWDLELKDASGTVSIESKFKSKSTDKIETIETTKWVDKKFSSYEFKRMNSKEHALLELKNDKYTMTYTKDGESKTASFDGDENLVAGPMVMLEIYKNWEVMEKGKDVKINFAAIDHQRSVEFDLRLKEKNKDGYVFEMAPSSFLIAMFVDTLYFKYKSKEEIPAEIVGRVLPVDVKDGSVVPIDGSFITAKSDVNLKNVVKF